MIYLKPEFSNRKKREKKGFSFYPLNSRVLGSEAHHMDETIVIYIPKDIHKAMQHDHNKPETMRQINRIALEYLFTGTGEY